MLEEILWRSWQLRNITFTNNLTVWGSLDSSNIWLLTVYSFALKQFVGNLDFIVQHEYKQLQNNTIATGAWW